MCGLVDEQMLQLSALKMISTLLPVISKGGWEKERSPILRLLTKVRLLNPVCLRTGIKACVYVEKKSFLC